MKAAVAALDETPPGDAGALFTKVGMTLVSTVGGASGPLFGTFFLRHGRRRSATPTQVTPAQLADGAARRARRRRRPRQGRGRGQDDVRRAGTGRRRARRARSPTACRSGDGARSGRVAAAEAGRDATIPMLARKGRASYLGERSVGHQDPGATSVALLLRRGRPRLCLTWTRRRPTPASASSSSRTAGRWRGRRSRWPRRCCTAARCGSRSRPGWTSTTFGTDAVRDQGGDRGGGRPGRRRRPDGPRQRGPQRRAGARPARRPDGPRPGRAVARRRSSRGWSSPPSPPPAGPARAEVAAEARAALMGKAAHLGGAPDARRPRTPAAAAPPATGRRRRSR